MEVRRTMEMDITSDIRSIVEVFGPTCFGLADSFGFKTKASIMMPILTSPFFLIFQNS
jgi:hypothetical protein